MVFFDDICCEKGTWLLLLAQKSGHEVHLRRRERGTVHLWQTCRRDLHEGRHVVHGAADGHLPARAHDRARHQAPWRAKGE